MYAKVAEVKLVCSLENRQKLAVFDLFTTCTPVPCWNESMVSFVSRRYMRGIMEFNV